MDITNPEVTSQILKIGLMSAAGFVLAMALTPVYTHFAYKHKWWKKMRTKTVDGEKAKIYQKLHGEKHKRNIPRSEEHTSELQSHSLSRMPSSA